MRRCNRHAIPIYVTRRGDPDAGVVVIKVLRSINDVTVLISQTEGTGIVFQVVLSPTEHENKADEFIDRQIRFDEDVWVIDIEDIGRQWDTILSGFA